MTPDERQALREKHSQIIFQVHPYASERSECKDCYEAYPCDVIKVLDVLDRVAGLAQEFIDLGIISVYESALEIGEIIMKEIDQ